VADENRFESGVDGVLYRFPFAPGGFIHRLCRLWLLARVVGVFHAFANRES
jgi:hypothetical protein